MKLKKVIPTIFEDLDLMECELGNDLNASIQKINLTHTLQIVSDVLSDDIINNEWKDTFSQIKKKLDSFSYLDKKRLLEINQEKKIFEIIIANKHPKFPKFLSDIKINPIYIQDTNSHYKQLVNHLQASNLQKILMIDDISLSSSKVSRPAKETFVTLRQSCLDEFIKIVNGELDFDKSFFDASEFSKKINGTFNDAKTSEPTRLDYFDCSTSEITLHEFSLSDAEKILLKRIKGYMSITLQGFLEIEVAEIKKIKGISLANAEVFRNLQNKILAEFHSLQQLSHATRHRPTIGLLIPTFSNYIHQDQAPNISGLISDVTFNLENFSEEERSVLIKIKKKIEFFSLRDMLKNNSQDIFSLHGLNKLDAFIYTGIKDKILNEFLSIVFSPDPSEALSKYFYLFINGNIPEISSAELDDLLIEQFESLLFNLDPSERSAMMGYYSFQSERKTLDE